MGTRSKCMVLPIAERARPTAISSRLSESLHQLQSASVTLQTRNVLTRGCFGSRKEKRGPFPQGETEIASRKLQALPASASSRTEGQATNR
jgi:hypothetical protein